MLRNSTMPQHSLFKLPESVMTKRISRKYENLKSWYKSCFQLITQQMNADNFISLFKDTFHDSPTYSIRILVSVSFSDKEFGCRNKQLNLFADAPSQDTKATEKSYLQD